MNSKASERIRASAKELFYREGIRAVGVDQIVKRARTTKPSLYRSFESKDVLAAECARDFAASFWQYFESALAAHPGNARAQLGAFFEALSARARKRSYRGCGLTNAAIEYPDRAHPARLVAEAHKREVRRRLTGLARELGAPEPELLADGLALLLEGAYASSQLFAQDGPVRSVAKIADRLIEASLPGSAAPRP